MGENSPISSIVICGRVGAIGRVGGPESQRRDNRKNGNTFWADSISKEMKNVKVAFSILPDSQKAPIGYQQMNCHIIFDIKMDDFSQSLN